MLINGIDISSLGVKLYDRVLNSNSINTVDDWLDGDIQPTNIRQQEKFRNIKLKFLVLGQNEQDAFYRISRLTKELKQATVIFDDIDLSFDVSVYGPAQTDKLKNGNFIVSYNLHSDYAKGSREIYTTNANLTNAFKLNVLYYQNSTQLLATESITIKASAFTGVDDTLASIGVDLDKYLPDYYNRGVATNLNGLEINYANLQYLGTLIINYSPIQYNLDVNYLMDDGTGFFNETLQETITFTYPQLQGLQTIGQLIRPQRYKPEGYTAEITFDEPLTVENILALSPIQVLYKKIENALSKNVLVGYYKEDDDGNWQQLTTTVVNINETQFYDGITLGDLINIGAYRPDHAHYNTGYIVEHNNNELITYDTLDLSYSVRYPLLENIVYVEYYAGVYPGWYRIATSTLTTKYRTTYEDNFSLAQLGIAVDRYHSSEYENGAIYNSGSLDTYDNVINAGVIQIYYAPIDYEIVVNFYTEGTAEPITDTFTINALDFFGDPVLSDLIPINVYRPNGYQFDPDNSYSGELTLSALTQASPITITFEEIEAERTKNILIHYKQELASVFSAINTSLITINESDCVGGVRLRDLINLDLYKPEYYESGALDGYSANVLLNYEDIRSEYNVLYLAASYATPVRYYTDDVNDQNWIGSTSINYRIIDFETSTTLYDLGLNVNAFKPSYCDDGVIQYRGAVNFQALRALESINIVYDTIAEPGEDDGIDYPHRFLFLQHNDLGDFEGLHPEWTLNHAFINTGITAQDMSKLTVIMECKRVDENVPLHEVNGAYGYLFGSYAAGMGGYYMRFNNQTQYHAGELTGVNTYEAKAGQYSSQLTLTEENAIGWSLNSGIYASARDGYSNATFTYTNPLQTENTRMVYPLYLFANNSNGSYEYGLAGIGIYGCRIYYDNVLVRDFIPVQFYDKIGDQVAPSNCLYDKITKTFFEDGSHMNSFNIIDDDRYEDTNPEHKIGFCYVNYYQGATRFKTSMFYFRASDFIDQVYEPYTKWGVDENQPAYYKPGVITGYNNIDRSFNGLNNHTFSVVYEEDENQITVNYYKDSGVGEPELLASETMTLKESDFYQVPTFGDIVRLNKYKPEGYKTDYEFPEPKVSLTRVLRNSPYDIIYEPETEPLEDYTTKVRYIKKVFGIRNYEVIDELTLHFDQTNFRDGEYIDFYIDKNALKPEHYYLDGEEYEWYPMDERLTTPEDLKELYIIKYDCEKQYLPINYYTDDWDEENLIASATFAFQLDDFDPEYPFYIVDYLPNNAINKFRPANCAGGVLQNSEVAHTFLTLVQLEEIAIVYDSIIEPHDPTEAYYQQKVLYWGDMCNKIYPSYIEIGTGVNNSYNCSVPWRIPYIDLGYTPKEIGRLRVEWTGASKPIGVESPISAYGCYSTDYATIFGYCGAPQYKIVGNQPIVQAPLMPDPYTKADMVEQYAWYHNEQKGTAPYNIGSKGYFYIKPRIPNTSTANWVYTTAGPTSIDGQPYMNQAKTASGELPWDCYYVEPGITTGFRRGFRWDTDDNYDTIDVFNDYRFSKRFRFSDVPDKETDGYMQINGTDLNNRGIYSYEDWQRIDNQDGLWIGDYGMGNPFTVVLDAYNNYCSIWNYHDSNTPFTWKFDDTDYAIWEDIERPRGSLSLFTATNPTTGKPNYLTDIAWNYPSLSQMVGSYSNTFEQSIIGFNPYTQTTDAPYGTIIYEVETVVQPGGDNTTPIVQIKTQTRNVRFATWQTPCFPWQAGGVLWSLKIYDRDRLVRDLVPVAQGDVIYDYTMPEDGLFDLITEIFFGNSNPGHFTTSNGTEITFEPYDLYVVPDILTYGKITTNYYDYDNTFITNKFVDIPTWFCGANTTIEEILAWNDYKPDDYHHDGWIDVDQDWSWWGNKMNLAQIYEMGAVNVAYRLRTFTKTVVYYRGDVRVGSRDLMYSLQDIENATTLADLGIDVDLYADPHFKPGRVVYNEAIIANDDIEAFINAPSPIVVYDKFTRAEAPNLLYVEYYRGGAYEDGLITLDENDANYLDCDLTARVLNPSGAIKYYNHYHQALYEDENFGEFIPYQVRVIDKYAGLHAGPARKYRTLSMIITADTYTIIQERNGWGRLREYPNAWILLSATEPITGPGQNPDYDVADSTTATIPFGEYVDISRMTIDRLWCYAPEVESWIKAEDISFNQAGKLYNGLGIEVVDLSEVQDWSSISSLADLGIDLQKYKLRFHNASTASYNGAFTYAALSAQHSLVSVYPETIYNYSCIYYKDNKAEINRLGTSAFSCSISDWNPDWDTFIATSWQTVEIYGDATVNGTYSSNNPNRTRKTVYSETDINGEIAGYVYNASTVDITGVSITSGTYTYYPVAQGELTGYMRADDITVNNEYGGTMEVNPTLYRDTVLTLTWDYFGFERNLFKPQGYCDGIYLWNPRSWDKDNVKFSFQELISCGTQYVIYPIFDPDTYKIWIQGNYLGLYDSYHSTSQNVPLYFNNPGIMIDLSDTDPEHTDKFNVDNHYDLYVMGEWRNDLGAGAGSSPYGNYWYLSHYKNDSHNFKVGPIVAGAVNNLGSTASLGYYGFRMPVAGTANKWNIIGYAQHNIPTAIENIKNGDTLIGDISMYRYSPTAVGGIGNAYEARETEYYLYGTTTKMEDNINLTNFHRDSDSDYNLSYTWCRGVLYAVISYYDNMMIHYYIPVPKGLWYRYDGEEHRIPANGLFDLLTGDFQYSFCWATYNNNNRAYYNPYVSGGNMRLTGEWYVDSAAGGRQDGKDLVFLRQAPIVEAGAYNLFNGWEYTTNDVNTVKVVSTATTGYAQPDIYSIQVRSLPAGLIVPISQETSDAAHRVVGEWNKSGDQWIESDKLTYTTFGYTLHKQEQTISLVPGTITNFKVYNNPEKEHYGDNSSYSYGSAPAVIKTFYYVDNDEDGSRGYLYDGQHWIPKIYTNLATTTLNKNYVITHDTHYYRFPVAANEYRISTYLYGERITVLYVCDNNTNWGYTGQGWIELDGNTSEVL